MEKKEGLINLVKAGDYLNCSHQWLGKTLNAPEDHPIKQYFRHYAGAWRTTYALLDKYFETEGDTNARKNTSEI